MQAPSPNGHGVSDRARVSQKRWALCTVSAAMVIGVDPARASALNEQELWREMVRWSGGRIVEERGVLLVSGPSAYLRVAIRTDPGVDGAAVVARATEFFAPEPVGFIVLVRRPGDEDIERAALAAGFRAGWTECPMAISRPPSA